MNNKPVAWMSQGGDVSRSADYFVEMGFTDLIPLYTHPKGFNWSDVNNEQLMNEVRSRGYIISNAQVSAHPVKELTDEEIIAVGNAVVNHIDSNEGWLEFARAILRKAQEK